MRERERERGREREREGEREGERESERAREKEILADGDDKEVMVFNCVFDMFLLAYQITS